MLLGKPLNVLAQEILRQRTAAKDFLSPARSLRAAFVDDVFSITVGDSLVYPVKEFASQQMSADLDIPYDYFRRMRDQAPQLLTNNVNTWLERSDKKKLVRTLDNDVRAFLSSTYRPLDNAGLAETVLPVLEKHGCKVVSCDITDTRMYIHAVDERTTREVKVGDAVQAGVIISNSEVGKGPLSIQPLVYRLKCSNGLILPDSIFKRRHIGKRNVDVSDWGEFVRDDTRQAEDLAVFLRARDMTEAALDIGRFAKSVEVISVATSGPEIQDPVKSVNLTAKNLGLTKDESSSLLSKLASGGDMTRWGMTNAVTALAHDSSSYDRAVELEALGAEILAMNATQWNAVVHA